MSRLKLHLNNLGVGIKIWAGLTADGLLIAISKEDLFSSTTKSQLRRA